MQTYMQFMKTDFVKHRDGRGASTMEDGKKQDRKVRPFFIMAVRDGSDYAKTIRAGKERVEDQYSYVSSDSIRTIINVKKGAKNDVSKVCIQGANISYYIPLPPEKLLELFRENGYEIYGPGELKKIASIDHDDTPSLPPSPSVP